jgi:PAS domain S-box-containing protein
VIATTLSWTRLLDVLFEDALVGHCLVAPDGTILRANAEWQRAAGATGDVLGEAITALFPGALDAAPATHARARAGHRVEVPRHARKVNGRESWWDGSIDPIPMEGGTGLLITMREVTSQVEGNEARLAQVRLEHTLESIAEGFFALGPDWRIVAANELTARYLGKPLDAVIGSDLWEVAGLPDSSALQERFERARATGEPVHFEYAAVVHPGFWAEIHLYPRGDQLEVYFSDISARKQAEQALQANEERFRAAFEASPDAINVNRLRDGVYITVNDGFTRVSGWSRQEVIGRSAIDLNIWVDMEQRGRFIERVARNECVQDMEVAFRRKDDSVITASLSAQAFVADGETFLLAITRDVSALKQAEAALREADRRKDEFLAMLSHELRNPLAPIRNATYLLERVDPSGEHARRARGVLRRQSEHLTRLVDDLLDVTRITRGKIALQRARIDLRDAVERAAEDFRPTMAERGIAFRIELPEREVVAYADPTRVNQVVANLLNNASKFTRRDGEVVVSLRPDRTAAEIRVRDTGAGIDPTVLPRIFDAFMQAEQTLARSEGGLGLGLALVKGIVELHGGEVRAHSAGIGAGTEFVVRLPLLVGRADASSERGPAHAASTGRRVLVVDDNVDAAESLAEILRMFGHEVDVAYDGTTALAKLESRRPDVVLSDIGLPGMSGYELAKAIRASGRRGVQLIALSGYAQGDDVRRAKEAGFDAHVAKPPDLEELARLLA